MNPRCGCGCEQATHLRQPPEVVLQYELLDTELTNCDYQNLCSDKKLASSYEMRPECQIRDHACAQQHLTSCLAKAPEGVAQTADSHDL